MNNGINEHIIAIQLCPEAISLVSLGNLNKFNWKQFQLWILKQFSSTFHFHLDCYNFVVVVIILKHTFTSICYLMISSFFWDSFCMNAQIVGISDRSTLTFAYSVSLFLQVFCVCRLQLNKISTTKKIIIIKTSIKEKQTLSDWVCDAVVSTNVSILFFCHQKPNLSGS